MKIEVTYFVVMDKVKSTYLVNKTVGSLSKMPNQAMQFSTYEQAESAIQFVYKKWKDSDRYCNEAKFKEIEFAVFRMKRTHELLPLTMDSNLGRRS